MPVGPFPELRLPRPDRRATLAYMPGSDVPVIRQPFEVGDAVPYWATGEGRADPHLLYDLDSDPAEAANLAGTRAEASFSELLRHALESVEAPADQYERLGL